MFVLLMAGLLVMQAQDVLLVDSTVWKSPKTIYAYEKHHVRDIKTPVPYTNVRESDVIWSKIVWRKIVLTEKQNLKLYYPLEPIGDRKSLWQVIIDAITDVRPLTGGSEPDPNCYDCITPPDFTGTEFEGARALIPFQDDLFKNPYLSMSAVDERIKYDIGEGDVRTVKSENITAYVLKEQWFIDKKRSLLDVRIIGIQPEFFKTMEGGELSTSATDIFWIYFPQLRYYLCKYECFNPKNDAERWTYDMVFNMRYFSSYIIREENQYDNRYINDYLHGIDALLESERIKQQIMEFEFDLWEY
ncbi:MAG: gliding motility protein GldN [Bacteroidales bacterium]|nr:gliding motility protein GldN [Bacteroidales bacterium]